MEEKLAVAGGLTTSSLSEHFSRAQVARDLLQRLTRRPSVPGMAVITATGRDRQTFLRQFVELSDTFPSAW
jgi:hypothetical protein